MAKIAILTLIVLVSTGFVAGPARAADDAVARLTAAAADPGTAADAPIGPIALMMLNNNLYSCYEMFARIAGDRLTLNGRSVFFNNQAFAQAAIGFAILSGSNLLWGIEGFPNPGLQVAAKIGGLLALANLGGNGYGFHLLAQQIIAFQFLTHLIGGPCPQQFIAADQ